MIIAAERRNKAWKSLSKSDVEDISLEVSQRGRMEGIFTWSKARLKPGGMIKIEIEDKAKILVRCWPEAVVMTGLIRKSAASMFLSSVPEDVEVLTKASMRKGKATATVVRDGKPEKTDMSGTIDSLDGHFGWAMGHVEKGAESASFNVPASTRFLLSKRGRYHVKLTFMMTL